MKNKCVILIILLLSAQSILFILTTTGCKKKKLPTYYLTQDFKDYAVFSVGSYWVYEDSATSIIDTIKLTSSTTNIVEYEINSEGDVGFYYEEYKALYYSTFFNTIYTYKGMIFENNGFDYFYYFFYNPRIIYFISDIEIGTGYSAGLGVYIYECKLDTVNILGNSYLNVKVLKNKYPLQGVLHSKTYNSKNIGRVRIEINDTLLGHNYVWNLKNYNINN